MSNTPPSHSPDICITIGEGHNQISMVDAGEQPQNISHNQQAGEQSSPATNPTSPNIDALLGIQELSETQALPGTPVPVQNLNDGGSSESIDSTIGAPQGLLNEGPSQEAIQQLQTAYEFIDSIQQETAGLSSAGAQAFVEFLLGPILPSSFTFPPSTNPMLGGPIPLAYVSGFDASIAASLDAYLASRPSRRGPTWDVTAFVDALEAVDLSAIPTEDMRCPFCWMDFGTTNEDDPSFVWTPEPELQPELSARLTAFRALPFCRGRPDNDPVKTPCGHIFGKGCLIQSLEESGTSCPMCRKELRPQREVLRNRYSSLWHSGLIDIDDSGDEHDETYETDEVDDGDEENGDEENEEDEDKDDGLDMNEDGEDATAVAE